MIFRPEWNHTARPIHRAASVFQRIGFEGYVGQTIPQLPLFDSLDDPQLATDNAYYASRSLVLMAISPVMAWIGSTLSSWLDRRR